MSTVQVTRLANGLTVATDRMDTVESASVGVWIGAGTRDERVEINGVSHLLEHMAFKGTRKRSALAIAEEIEAVGGHLNAYTSREHTAFYAKVLKEDLALAVDILSDIIQNATVENEELVRERAVVVQEIHQSYDTPDDVVFDHFQETAFPDQALGRPVMGRADVIGGMGRDTVVGYMRDRYAAGEMVMTAAGRIEHEAVVRLAETAFRNLPTGNGGSREPGHYVGGDFRENRPLEQVHLLLGFGGTPFEDPNFYPASVLSILLGGGMSSRLFQEIRENRGMAYSVYSFQTSYTDTGLFGIYAGTGAEQSAELIPLVCDELEKVCEAISEDEVARARAQLKASLLMALESTTSRSEHLARQLMIYGRPLTTEEIVEHIDAVDADAVLKAARAIFTGPPTLTSLGPTDRVVAYDTVAKRFA